MSLTSLPPELKKEILSYLDIKDLVSVAASCKSMNDVSLFSEFWYKCKCEDIRLKYLNDVVLSKLNRKLFFNRISFENSVDFSSVDLMMLSQLFNKAKEITLYYSFEEKTFNMLLENLGSGQTFHLENLIIICTQDQYKKLSSNHCWDSSAMKNSKLNFHHLKLTSSSLSMYIGEICFNRTGDDISGLSSLTIRVVPDPYPLSISFEEFDSHLMKLAERMNIMFKQI